jgi:hypothetical protein
VTSDERAESPERELVEEAMLWRLPLKGLRVWRVSAGVRLDLDLDESPAGEQSAVKISVNGYFACGPEHAAAPMDADAVDRASLGPALNLFYATVSEAVAYKSGQLELRFLGDRRSFSLDGWVLRADPDDKYESWEVRGPGSRVMVCGPGGTLAIWR